jgi:hypothetical protein
MLLLAETNPDAAAALLVLQGIFWLAAGIGALAVAANSVRKFYAGSKPTEHTIAGQPVTVKTQVEFATKDEHQDLAQKVEKEVKELDTKLDHKFTQLNRERSQSIAGLHAKIELGNSQLREEMRADQKATQARLDVLPERVIRILKDTGVIEK